jgi:hypothetical protein
MKGEERERGEWPVQTGRINTVSQYNPSAHNPPMLEHSQYKRDGVACLSIYTLIEDWTIHRTILYNHLWQERLDRGADLGPLGQQ